MAQYELNVLDYWLIVKKRKYTIAVTAALVVGCTLTLAQLVRPSPIYEASARVKFDRTSTVANLLLESLSTQGGSDMGTQAEVIKSFPVIERVAMQFGIVAPNASAEMRRSGSYLSTIYALQHQIRATQEGPTNIIKITATADSSQRAERLANAVAEAYREENIKSQNRMVTESRGFVEAQLALLQGRLKEAEDALLQFKEKEGQVFLSDEARVALETFTKLEGEYDRISRLKGEAVRQIVAFRKAGTSEEKPGERIFTEEPTAALSVLNGRLTDLQQERATLLINYTTQHPKVVELDQKIAHVKSEMIRELESKIRSFSDREGSLKEQIGLYRTRYFSFPKAAVELSRLEREVKVTADLYATLKGRHQELLVKGSQQIVEVTIIEPAVAPVAAANAPDNTMNVFVSALMGVVLGIVLAFTRESFDTSIGTIEGVEEFLQVPVLGVIPQFDHATLKKDAGSMLPPGASPDTVEALSKLVCLYNPKSVLAEAFRALRTNIQFSSMGHDVKTVLFTSAGLGEGKTTTIINVALALAQDGKRVLLVDADLRRPIVHARFGLQREPGLSEVLVGGVQWKDALRTVTDLMLGTLGVDQVMNSPGLDNLHLLTSGRIPQNPAELLGSPGLTALIADLQKHYDVVLFDTPPILPIADAVTMSAKVDGTILVYQVGRIGRTALKRTKFLLEHAHAKVLGLVLTNVRSEITPEYGYYRYEYR